MRYVPPYGVTNPQAGYVNGNPATGIQGSIPPAEAFENHLRELSTLIEKSGSTPTASDLAQVLKSVRSQRLNYAVDTGAANALVVQYDPVFSELTAGLPLRVKAAYTNTTAASILVDGIGPVSIKRCNGAVLDAGDITAGEVVDLVYDGVSFQLTNFRGFTADIENTNNYYIKIPYCADSDAAANAITATFSPPITALNAGDLIEVMINGANTGATSITVNALPSKTVKTVDGYDLQAGQLANGMIAFLTYDGTVFQLCNPVFSRTGPGTESSMVQIAKRVTLQDTEFHITNANHPSYVEAFRFSYAPVTPDNKLWVQLTGVYGSGTGAQSVGKRNILVYLSYSTNNGSTWTGVPIIGENPPSGTQFMHNPAYSVWECPSSLVNQRDECFTMTGELAVPAGPPTAVLFRVMYTCGSALTPDVFIAEGTFIHVIEYTPGTA